MSRVAPRSPDFSPLVLQPYELRYRWPVIGLLAGCYSEYGQFIELDTLDEDLLDVPARYAPPHTFQVLLDRGVLVGTVAVKVGGQGNCDLKRVFLDPAWRGRGYGRRLVEWAFHWAAEQGCERMDIWTDVLFLTAHHMYRRLGGEETGQRRPLGGRNQVEELHFRQVLRG